MNKSSASHILICTFVILHKLLCSHSHSTITPSHPHKTTLTSHHISCAHIPAPSHPHTITHTSPSQNNPYSTPHTMCTHHSTVTPSHLSIYIHTIPSPLTTHHTFTLYIITPHTTQSSFTPCPPCCDKVFPMSWSLSLVVSNN